MSITGLPWVEDGIEESEREAVQELVHLATFGHEAFGVIASTEWVSQELTEAEGSVIDILAYIASEELPVLAREIASLPWIVDGVDEIEASAVVDLGWAGQYSPELAGEILSWPWVVDSMAEVEAKSIDGLRMAARNNPALALTTASLPWIVDGVDAIEANAVVDLGWAGQYSPELAGEILSWPWVVDSMAEVEATSIDGLRMAARNNPALALTTASLPWIVDGVDDIEANAVVDLGWAGQYSPELAGAVLSMSWVQDDIKALEAAGVQELKWIAKNHPTEALRIAQMPFLAQLEPADFAAMESLSKLSSFRPDSFLRIMAHPTISAGISDDWAKIVATLYGTVKSNPQLVEALLDPQQVVIEVRSFQLPLAGEVELAIIRLGPGAGRSMDLLEYSVRAAEAFMNAPLPTRYVALLYADGVTETFAGTNFGTHMAILPEYDVDDESYEAQYAGYIVAHEVAHYYWSGNANWLDEGAAELMAILSENARVRLPLDPDNYPCSHAPNIATLERLSTSSSDGARSAFRCNYSLGERLFLDLHRSLEEDEFKQGFRSLYEVSKVSDEDETTEGISLGIVALREAFGSATSTPVVTARWYEGTERFDRSRLDKGRIDPELPSINGSFTLVGVALSYDNCLKNKRELNFSIREIPDRVTVCLKYTYDVDSPQQADIDIVVWFEDGFPIQRISRTIEAMEGYIGAQWPAYIGPTQWNWWAPGRYYIYVYHEGVKVGEAEFMVLP